MAAEIVMPKVDMVMEDGTFIEWLKQEGDLVTKGEPLFIIGTDKADIEVEAPASGQLANLGAQRDDLIRVSTVIGYIVQPGEVISAKAAKAEAPATAVTNGQSAAVMPSGLPKVSVDGETHGQESIRSTPLARAQARELGLNLAEIAGTGPRGRIHKADIERHVAALVVEAAPVEATSVEQSAVVSPSPLSTPSKWPAPDPGLHARQREPLKGARAIIAERMSLSASVIPHIHLNIQVDMSEAARLRQQVNPQLEKSIGQKASYTAIIARAVASLLPKHPYLNSSLVDKEGDMAGGKEIVLWEEVNLGIATNQGGHLIVPVIRQAQRMNLEQLVQEMARVLDLAQKLKLPPADMKGSTFSITNLGMFGITSFTPIINPPEAAILAVGQIQETPVALKDEVVIRPLLALTLAADHRIMDGAAAALFLADLKMILENPYLLI